MLTYVVLYTIYHLPHLVTLLALSIHFNQILHYLLLQTLKSSLLHCSPHCSQLCLQVPRISAVMHLLTYSVDFLLQG